MVWISEGVVVLKLFSSCHFAIVLPEEVNISFFRDILCTYKQISVSVNLFLFLCQVDDMPYIVLAGCAV